MPQLKKLDFSFSNFFCINLTNTFSKISIQRGIYFFSEVFQFQFPSKIIYEVCKIFGYTRSWNHNQGVWTFKIYLSWVKLLIFKVLEKSEIDLKTF